MLKKSAKAVGSAALAVGVVATTAAVSVATDGVTDVYFLNTKKKKNRVSTEKDSNDIIEEGKHVHYPVYELSPLIRLGKRWYNPFTLKQEFLKDHRYPKKIRYADIRLRKPKTKKGNKKRKTKSKNFIKERQVREISVAESVRDPPKRSRRTKGSAARTQSFEGARTVVSRKTTEFADGSVKKEIFFSGELKICIIFSKGMKFSCS